MSSSDLQTKHYPLKGMLRRPFLRDLPICLLLFLASRASVLGVYPFALSMYCSVFDKSASYLALLSVGFGIVSTGNTFMGIKQLLAMIFFWLYTRLRDDWRETVIFSSVVCACAMFVGGCILMICDIGTIYDFVALIIESVLSSLMYIVFEKGGRLFMPRSVSLTRAELVSAAVCLGIFISGIQEISIFGINISHTIISFIVMSIALFSDISLSGSGGLCVGLICSLNESASVTLVGFYGLSGLLCSLFRGMKKYGIVLGFLSSGALILLYVGNSFEIPVSISEMLVAAAFFVLVPNKFHEEIHARVTGAISQDDVVPDEKITSYISEKLFRTSNAFSSLSDTFRCVSDKRLRHFHREAASIIQETVERVCKNCADCSRCWQTDFGVSWKIAFSLLETYEKKGICTLENAESDFLTHCIIPETFLAEFNHSYELFRIDTIHKGEAILSRDLICDQYSLFSDTILELANSLDGEFDLDDELSLFLLEKLTASEYNVRDVKVLNCGNLREIYVSFFLLPDPDPLCQKLGELLNSPVFFEDKKSGGILKFSSDGLFKIEVGTCQIPKDGETVCGDSVFKFKTDDMKFYAIICDGMGSGAAARSESLLTGNLLRQFLLAGLGAKTAVSMVNSSLALKQDRESFSCVDMVCIDLTNGKTEFYKIGGTKSFIRHDSEIETVFCESLPFGIMNKASTLSVSKLLSDDDVIVMMSDGVCDTEFGVFSSEKMKRLLNDEEKSMTDLSNAIMKTALKKRNNKPTDDMTVVTVQLKSGIR